MKSTRLLAVLLLATVTGGLAGYLALKHLRQPAPVARPTERVSTVQVAVAMRELPMGTVLRAEDVKLVAWPGDAVPAGYATALADLEERGLIAPVSANEPILTSKLADRGSGGGLPVLIPEGMRAVSVRVDEVIQVAGFVTAGTRVDVLLTYSEDGPTQTRTILQNVQTLAAGQTIQRDLEGKPQDVTVITLLVTPQQAERLALAASEGRIQLALRNLMDGQVTVTSGARLTSFADEPRPVTAPAAAAPRPVQASATVVAPQGRTTVVETLRGGERTLRTF
jgi:pilus assembly protein CpaB